MGIEDQEYISQSELRDIPYEEAPTSGGGFIKEFAVGMAKFQIGLMALKGGSKFLSKGIFKGLNKRLARSIASKAGITGAKTAGISSLANKIGTPGMVKGAIKHLAGANVKGISSASELAIAFNKKELVKNFSSTIRQILFLIVPATVLLITLRAQIVRVILGTGQFNWEDTILAINTLGFFAISLFAQAIIPLLIRVFYARHNSHTPFYIGLFSVVVNLFLSLWLVRGFGIAGLALAFSISSILNFILLWLVLRFEIGNMDELRILTSTIKFSAAAIASGITVQGVKLVIWPFIDMTKFWGVLSQGLASGLFGLFIYIAVCSILRSEELFNLWNAIKRRLPFKKIEAGDQGEARGI